MTGRKGSRRAVAAPTTADRRQIAIIDADADERQLYTDCLQLAGYATMPLTAADSDADLRRAAAADLVVADAPLPGDAGDLPVRLRAVAGPDGKAPPVLAIGWQTLPGDREGLTDRGYAGYLVKPIRITAFLECVEGLLAPDRPSPT